MKQTNAYNNTAPPAETSPAAAAKEESHWKTLLKDLAFIALFYVIFTLFAWRAFHIPSGSMEPTLEVGDRIFVSKYAYGYNRYSVPFNPGIVPEARLFSSLPQRGEVIVFTLPYLNSTDFIKRLIGLPGDTVQMIAGRLYINDKVVPRTFTRDVPYTNYRGYEVRAKEYSETLPGGVTHRIFEQSDSGSLDNTEKFIVPQGHYFMMGDNRDDSGDSRVVGSGAMGFIAHKYLVGRAAVTTFSLYDCDQGKDISCPLGIPVGRFFNNVR